jgi:hypothetical protein
MEIWKRGVAAWTFDVKNRHIGWKWMVDPIPDVTHEKRVSSPASYVVHIEQLQVAKAERRRGR